MAYTQETSDRVQIKTIETPDDPYPLATVVQQIGFTAYRQALVATRTHEEVSRVYDPWEEIDKNAHELFKEMKAKEAEGRFNAVVAMFGDQAVGYAWASEPKPDFLTRALNKLRSVQPRVVIEDIAVLPEFQGRGVGTEMIRDLLKSFDPKQVPEAVVMQELPGAVDWFMKRGFGENMHPPEPDHRFGTKEKPVALHLLKGTNGVSDVRNKSALRYGLRKIPIEPLEAPN